jgi:CMP-N-acetylneuraminic acid synthetase
MTTVSVLINARLKSTRLPRKLVLPFAGSTLIDIALEKLDRMDFFAHRYFAAAEEELIARAVDYPNVELLRRDPAAVAPGYHDHKTIYAHYALIESDYIMWLNPCHPLLTADTLRKAMDDVVKTGHNSYTSVIPTTDWIFDETGAPVTHKQANVVSTAHSKKFFKVAHAFHVFRKAFFMKDYQLWTMTPNDPALIEIPEEQSYDVNTDLEFRVAEAAYIGSRKASPSAARQ